MGFEIYQLLFPPGIAISGGFDLAAYLDLKLVIKICMISRKTILTLKPSLVIFATLFIAGEIPKIIRAGVEAGLNLVTLTIAPSLGLSIKAGPRIGIQIDLIVANPFLEIIAFVDAINIEWCEAGIIMFPCGLSWKRHLEFEIMGWRAFANQPTSWQWVRARFSIPEPSEL